MNSTLIGTVIPTNPVHQSNAPVPILSAFSDIAALVKPVQPSKA